MGCYTDSVRSRFLAHPVSTPGGSDTMTVESCTSTCNAQGCSTAGMEYAGEYWCDNVYEMQAVPGDGCTMPWKGRYSEFCRGSDRILV